MTSEYQKTCNLREVKKRGEVTKRNVIACPYCGEERDGEWLEDREHEIGIGLAITTKAE